MNILPEVKETLKQTGSTVFTLLKIMIPISIIVKILSELGVIKIIGEYLNPAMSMIGLPGDFGLVWATTMITNIYGGLIVFFNLSLTNTYTVAQVTVLATMMLIAHTLPIEIRIAQKAGVRPWFTILLRISCALTLGCILGFIFQSFNFFQYENKMLWQPGIINPTWTEWIIGELRNYLMVFLIILGLITLIRTLKKTGALDKFNNAIEPGLRFLGMSKNAAPMTVIGMTLGVAYGGGLIIKEAKQKIVSKKDVFFSLSLMGLSHSLIEDTLLMIAIGASLVGILFARIIFTIIIIILLIRIINRLSKKTFEKYFVK